MDEDYLEISREQLAEIASAADRAASDRADELGLPSVAVMLGLDLAAEVAKKTFAIMALLGDEGAELLAEAIEARNEKEMHEEAERILRDEH